MNDREVRMECLRLASMVAAPTKSILDIAQEYYAFVWLGGSKVVSVTGGGGGATSGQIYGGASGGGAR